MPDTGPLAGVRVVDLTAMVMGPYCTQIMADLGADVIKVEPPQGDNTRYISVGPVPGMSGVFVNVNRGKRSVVLDLRSDDGRAALRALIERADVFIHSMRAKAIAALGFGYDDVAAINPVIVYTNCYGYGRRGPHRDRPAYDDTIQAECGLPAVQKQLTGEADYVGTIMADKVAGLTAVYATTMALVSYMATSTSWPCPVRSRWNTARRLVPAAGPHRSERCQTARDLVLPARHDHTGCRGAADPQRDR